MKAKIRFDIAGTKRQTTSQQYHNFAANFQ